MKFCHYVLTLTLFQACLSMTLFFSSVEHKKYDTLNSCELDKMNKKYKNMKRKEMKQNKTKSKKEKQNKTAWKQKTKIWYFE